MKMYRFLSVCLLVIGLPFLACTPSAGPPVEPKAVAPTSQVASASWEQQWANIVAQGKKEGVVTVYCSARAWTAATRIALTEAFKKKFGIDLEVVALASGPEIVVRVAKEKSAGLDMVDVIANAGGPLVVDMKPQGLLGDLEPVLLVPEVIDPKAWGGKLPFIDKDKKAIGMIVQIQHSIMYNTGLVSKGQITSFKDLLKPQYKGQIILNDPTVSGSGNGVFVFLALSAWNPEGAKDFLRQLITQQDVVITRDTRLQVESVARGKYKTAMAPSGTAVKEFLQAGAPIDVALVREGSYANTSNGTIAVPTKSPHPNAARVFINWLLGREGQTIFSRNQVAPSLRVDVPPEGIDPRFVPQPGEKIFYETEESILFQGESRSLLAEVIRQATK